MKVQIAETLYPITFRRRDAKTLGEHIKNRHSVVLIGMKRVGISNFLRYFLYHKDIQNTYINDGGNHLFIPVDLNDLIEREISPFWVLTQKRILDAAEYNNIPKKVTEKIEKLFSASIQTQDLFLTIDCVRKSLLILIENGYFPSLFFIRFDRLKDVVTPEFFDNLQGLVTATSHNITYVFTSYRSLDVLAPEVFAKPNLAAFAYKMCMKPADGKDVHTIFNTMNKNYKLSLNKKLNDELFHVVDGYSQYLFFALAYLLERKDNLPKPNELPSLLFEDERINLQSEELWESLTEIEQTTLIKIQKGEKLSKEERINSQYLWETGIINSDDDIFSILFSFYIQRKNREFNQKSEITELTRKEYLLLNLLLAKRGNVCEREDIISSVWPEAAFGVSDWAVDRLVARLRSKIKAQNSGYEIVTVKTRGYKINES